MDCQIVKQPRDDEALRKSFMRLAVEIFDLSFEQWHRAGFWTDNYIPYAAVKDNEVIANASVNRIDTLWRGKERRYLQIGTVMTKAEFRGRGLCRMLLEEILNDWRDKSDAVYLYANDTVLDFYPKFGFQKATEYEHSILAGPGHGDFKRLDMDSAADRALLMRCYRRQNPYSELPLRDNEGLLMFYCAGPMKDCVYYSKSLDTVCVAELEEERISCFDIFGAPAASLEAVLAALCQGKRKKAVLGFTPLDGEGWESRPLQEEDATLFVLSGKENPFAEGRVRMPALSHA